MRETSLLLVVLIASLPACVTSTTQLTNGKALDPGDFQLTGTYAFPLHTNLVRESLEAAETIEELYEGNTEKMSEDETRDLLDTALNWALFSNLGITELVARAGLFRGPLEGIDMGLRYNGASLKADLLWQLYESPGHQWFIATNFGYGFQFNITSKFITSVSLTNWARHDLEGSLIFGYAKENWFKAYLSPRYIYSLVRTEPKFSDEFIDNLPDSVTDKYLPSEYFEHANLAYFGGTIGMMVGYRHLFANLELTVLRLSFKPTVLREKRDFSGMLVSPTAGLTFLW